MEPLTAEHGNAGMKQSKGSKQIKSFNLSSLDGVPDVAVGRTAAAERHGRSSKVIEKSDGDGEDQHDDVAARNKRWGIG
jgi:hypothetical protein